MSYVIHAEQLAAIRSELHNLKASSSLFSLSECEQQRFVTIEGILAEVERNDIEDGF